MRQKSIEELREELSWELAHRVAEDTATGLERELPGFRITGGQLPALAEKIDDCIFVEIKILGGPR